MARAEKHVKSVQTTHDVEERAIGVSARSKRKGLPLVSLVREKGRAEDEARNDPVAGRLEMPALLRPHSELERRAGSQKGKGKDQRLDRVEMPPRRKCPRWRPQRHVVARIVKKAANRPLRT